MADTITTIAIAHERGQPPATVAARLLRGATEPREGLTALHTELADIAGGARGGRVTVGVESASAAAATATVVCDVSDMTAGDRLLLTVPGLPTVAITVVATGAVAASGQIAADAASDTASGAELVAALEAYPATKGHVTASNSSGTVTVTARRAGVTMNGAVFAKDVTTAGAFTITQWSGGAEPGALATGTCTINSDTNAIVADDTVTIGSVTLTWKASASGEGEVTLSAVDATAATNLAAVINAHSKLQGIVSAEAAAGVVTVTWLGSPRTGELIATSRAETNAGSVTWGASALASAASHAYQAAPVTYSRGAV